MSKRSDKVLLDDILDAVTQIETYTTGMTEDDFSRDRKTQDAVVRNLEIMGEAANRLTEDFRMNHTGIPWQLLRGLRNRIVHAYFGIDIQLIWEVVVDDLPPMKDHLKELLSRS